MNQEEKIEQMMQECPDAWKTKSEFFTWLKGMIRAQWKVHPVRTGMLKKHKVMLVNDNPKSMKRFPKVAASVCMCCGKVERLGKMQVDHRSDKPASLTKIEDIQSCAETLLLVCEEDLQILCVECHEVITLARERGISFEEAKIEKQVILFNRLKAKDQIKTLTELVKDETILHNAKNAAERKNLYREYLKGNL